MLLWLVCALLTGAVLAGLMRPLMGRPAQPAGEAETAVALYRDQLAEIERDRQANLLSGADADSATIEISRRLIAEPKRNGVPANDRAEVKPAWAYGLAAAIPILAAAIYLAAGSPGLPGEPYAERLARLPQQASGEDLVAKVEARLRADPNDGQGWDVIAPVYLRLGQPQASLEAYGNAIRLLGEKPDRLMGLAQASISASNGLIRDDARRALARAIELDAKRLDARLWLAIAKEQDGDRAGAAVEYRALLADAPREAPWRGALAERLRAVEGKAGKVDPAREAGRNP